MTSRERSNRIKWLVALLTLLVATTAGAGERVLVFDCGLKDDTMLPNVPEELERNALLGPLLRRELSELGHDIPESVTSDEVRAWSANGYLVDHPGVAAELGRAVKARWVAVCSQFKFSFLVSILRVHLIDVQREQVVTHAESWMRGAMTDTRITRRTVRSLGEQVDELLRKIASGATAESSAEAVEAR